jgi:ATP-dependent RNA helicase SUPV3L1/SUV3
VAAFPAWRLEGRSQQHITLHVGPTNSGKTYDALYRLSEVGEGWYLAPLRLLAFEVFDTLNVRGVPCNLLTGEERIDVPGASITAATVEMFNPLRSGRCVLIDEAHLLADPDRGWAWTRALMEAQAPEIHMIGAPIVQGLVERLAQAAAVEIDVVEHERLTPLRVADQPWPLDELPARTILVAFSRAAVLALKVDLERRERTVSVVYGNLPPEVRRNQAARFASGASEICVATDAVGMGLNLPADQVCFAEVEKFDGREQRLLTPNEIRQIGGRAGRYLYSQVGEVGATTQKHLTIVRKLFNMLPDPLTHARVAPTVEDIAMIPGRLAERLAKWAALESIPVSLRSAIKTADMAERIELASLLSQPEVDILGLPAAMKLINAPTQQNTRVYWRRCTSAILYGEPMPLPSTPNAHITSSADLEWAEMCIRCTDIYLWLSSRQEFRKFGAEVSHVRRGRALWSRWIDEALIHKIDAAPRCSSCGMRLPYNHRYRLCERCFMSRRHAWDYSG